MKALLALPPLLLLAACAGKGPTMEAASCAGADWRALGLADGASGTDGFAPRAAACGEAGFAADRAAYDAGWREGLARYCTASSGYEAGRAGEAYADACDAAPDLAYREGFARGRADRPAFSFVPSLGIGVSGGSSSGVGVGIGTGIGIGF